MKDKTTESNPSFFSKENLAKVLAFFAIIVFFTGVLSVYNGAHPMSNELFPNFAKTMLQDGVANMVAGIVLYASSRLLKSGKALSFWFYVTALLISVGQDLAIGVNFPFFTFLFGAWIMSHLLTLKKQGQLV